MAIGDVQRFLAGLPVGLPENDAVRAIAAVARHVSAVRGCAPPTAFDGQRDAPDGVDVLVDALPEADCTPDLLGLAWEQLLADDSRRAQGAHFTPRQGAQRVVRLAVESQERIVGTASLLDVGRVWDPACGGGAFLLAAARHIETSSGLSRSEIVESMFASDIDPVALRVCSAALSIWARGEASPRTANVDALIDLPADWPTDFSMVVGNPPFLGQLTTDTARSPEAAERLKAEYGELAVGYVDQAALFVELGLRRLSPGGVLGLILPQSFLGSRDASGVRTSAMSRAVLSDPWFDDDGLFEAAVDVIAIAMVKGDAASPTPEEETPNIVHVRLGDSAPLGRQTPEPTSWAPLLAAVQGVPEVQCPTGDVSVGDIAHVTAGFRQHFYGIADAVLEGSDVHRPDSTANGGAAASLITSGMIDPFANLWGRRPVKFARKKWNAPILSLDAVADAAVRSWFQARLVPKLLLASQTPVIELIADPDGVLAPSVPVVSVEPHDPDMLWHLAAAVSAPTTSAVLISNAAGTGLSATAVRVRARAIADVVLPQPGPAWDRGAEAARAATEAWDAGDEDLQAQSLQELAAAMVDAYRHDHELAFWWSQRLRKRP